MSSLLRFYQPSFWLWKKNYISSCILLLYLHSSFLFISFETFSPILQLLISPVFLGIFLLKVKEVYYYVKEDQSNKSIRSYDTSSTSRHGTLERQMNLVSKKSVRNVSNIFYKVKYQLISFVFI